MRVTGGSRRGLTVDVSGLPQLRPTKAMVREAMFSVIGTEYIVDALVADRSFPDGNRIQPEKRPPDRAAPGIFLLAAPEARAGMELPVHIPGAGKNRWRQKAPSRDAFSAASHLRGCQGKNPGQWFLPPKGTVPFFSSSGKSGSWPPAFLPCFHGGHPACTVAETSKKHRDTVVHAPGTGHKHSRLTITQDRDF